MTSRDAQKRSAAERAVEFVEDGMVLGLGTGSTVRFMLEILGERVRSGAIRDIAGVPTSHRTATLSRELGIPVTSLESEPRLDLTLDGADEVDPRLDLIKGHGGALLWEKIVATASDRLIIMVDETKLVERLGLEQTLPVEVVPFGWNTHLMALEELGAEVALRAREDGEPYRTDSNNYILDCRFPDGIADAAAVARQAKQITGVVDTGLFLDMADRVVVGLYGDARVLTRSESA